MKRVLLAYALAPLGALSVVALIIGSTLRTPADLFVGPLFGMALLAGVAYIAGALLLPVYFLLERLGKRGWAFYVPIATVAGGVTGVLMAWPEPFWRPLGFYAICSVAGALSGAVFSLVLRWRPNPPQQPTDGTMVETGSNQ